MLLNQPSNETDTLYAVPMRKGGCLQGTVHVFAASADEANALVLRPEYADAVDAAVREPFSDTSTVVAAQAWEVTDRYEVAEVMATTGQDIRAKALEERLEDEVNSLRDMLLQDDDSFARDLVRGYLERLTTGELLATTQVEEDLEDKVQGWLDENDPEGTS
ncbi:hypothetical protein TK90_2712 (plasmid) [Thioalkalivibrio sp. K90mix]|uniref:hypothetical protein n=1 Tax=Thioalkalivibrio sp. (strain K90mix) TaxID=396595 RepID=UPI000195A4CF|nr:hypothetical protein [Thioalkalivibrio sp. K90mix]ADC73198.1 hypothetical protein TK90_2712 [Thioalkalivibrio sp. K90mix]